MKAVGGVNYFAVKSNFKSDLNENDGCSQLEIAPATRNILIAGFQETLVRNGTLV